MLGEHDLSTTDKTKNLLLGLIEGNDLVVVDLSEAAFVDSSFLNVLVTAHKRAGDLDKKLRVQVGTAPIVSKILEITGLLSYFDVAHGREEALRT